MNSKTLNKHFDRVFYSFMIALILVLAGSAVASWYDTVTLPSEGNITPIETVAGIEVFEDSELSQPLTSLNWGNVTVNTVYNKSFYILNTGNATATYFMLVDNWNSNETETYISITWDFMGAYVAPNENIYVTLSLFISPDIPLTVQNFTCDIHLHAEKV